MFRRVHEKIRSLETFINIHEFDGDIETAREFCIELYKLAVRNIWQASDKIDKQMGTNPEDPQLAELQFHLDQFREYASKYSLKCRELSTTRKPKERLSELEVHENAIITCAENGNIQAVEFFRGIIEEDISAILERLTSRLYALTLKAIAPNNAEIQRTRQQIESNKVLINNYFLGSRYYQRLKKQAKENSWKQGKTNIDE